MAPVPVTQTELDDAEARYTATREAWVDAFRAMTARTKAVVAAADRFGDELAAEVEAGVQLQNAHEQMQAAIETRNTLLGRLSDQAVAECKPPVSRLDAVLRRKAS